MSDVIDAAQDLEQLQREVALAGARRALVTALPRRTHCVSCGEEIEPTRLAAVPTAQTCAFCARQIEGHR